MKIAEALLELDPDNDGHWTSDGLPLLDVVSDFVGRKVKRQEITNEGHAFNRDRARELREAHEAAAANGDLEATIDATEDAVDEADLAGETETPPASVDVAPQPDVMPDVLKMDAREVMKSRALTELALRELEVLCKDANDRKKQAEVDLDKYSFQVDILSRHLDRMSRTDPDPHAANVRAYQEQAFRAREERARAAKAFIAAGTSPKAVLEQLTTQAPIDRAFARNTTRGRHRPQVPLMPQRATGS